MHRIVIIICMGDEVRSGLTKMAPDIARCLEKLSVDESAWIAPRLKGFRFVATLQ